MRISDWSSDVCSSDLTRSRSSRCRCRSRTRRRKPEPGPARRSRWAIAPASLLLCPRRSHRLLHLAEQPDPAVLAARHAVEVVEKGTLLRVGQPCPADRKSVVGGKRVEVRVNQGGPRILTKTKTD